MSRLYQLSELDRVATKYPLRVCRSMHHCEVCAQSITLGQRYYDGGYGRRVHEACADTAPTGAGEGAK